MGNHRALAVRNRGVCHIFQTDSGGRVPLCGTREPFSGGLKFTDGLNEHHPGDYCEVCGRPPCPECDRGAVILSQKLGLPIPPWAAQLSNTAPG